MIAPASSTDALVDALAARARKMDLVAWRRIAALAEESELSFEDLRMLLALAVMEGPAPVREFGELAGFSIDVAYRATHRLRQRGYLNEEGRQYRLTPKGEDIVAKLDAARREGIQAYADQLDPADRDRLVKTFADTAST